MPTGYISWSGIYIVAGSLRSCEHVLHMYVIIGGGGRLRLAANARIKAQEEKDAVNQLKNKQNWIRKQFSQHLRHLPKICMAALTASYT